jgi:hypothetical protein
MKATRLSGLPQKKLNTGHAKLERCGITPERWLTMLSAGDAAMQRLADAWPASAGVVYAAKRVGKILGVAVNDVPAPAGIPGRYIVYLPPCIKTPADLRRSTAPMWKDQEWYDGHQYTAKPGYWEVLVPVPHSNWKGQQQQDQHIATAVLGLQRTPMLVDALLLAVHMSATGEDLLNGDWVRCPEQASDFRVVLTFCKGLLSVDGLRFVDTCGDIWASAARWLSS